MGMGGFLYFFASAVRNFHSWFIYSQFKRQYFGGRQNSLNIRRWKDLSQLLEKEDLKTKFEARTCVDEITKTHIFGHDFD